MKFLSVKYRITLGLVTILVSTMLLAIFTGFGPDARQATMLGRKRLCESIAINSSILLSRDDLTRMEGILRAMVERDDELLSAGIRRTDGQLMVQIGDHKTAWLDERRNRPKLRSRYRFGPETQDGARGGTSFSFRDHCRYGGDPAKSVDKAYRPHWRDHFRPLCDLPGNGFAQLDPSKAIPKRVRSALDALAGGLLVTDKKGRVMLANEAFARWAGQDADELIGRNVSAFPWSTPADIAAPGPYPWVSGAGGTRCPSALSLRTDRWQWRKTYVSRQRVTLVGARWRVSWSVDVVRGRHGIGAAQSRLVGRQSRRRRCESRQKAISSLA